MFDPAQLSALISDVDGATTSNQKGSSFESLAEYLFRYLDGVEVYERDIRMQSEEIDLVLWNAQREEILRPWEPVILVECKNWNALVGAIELDRFIAKLRRRCLTTGIFIAASGVTGGFINGNGTDLGATAIIREALRERIRVIVLTMDDIRMISSLDDIRNLIKKRYCGLFVHKIFRLFLNHGSLELGVRGWSPAHALIFQEHVCV